MPVQNVTLQNLSIDSIIIKGEKIVKEQYVYNVLKLLEQTLVKENGILRPVAFAQTNEHKISQIYILIILEH
jgi:hypothetical protein